MSSNKNFVNQHIIFVLFDVGCVQVGELHRDAKTPAMQYVHKNLFLQLPAHLFALLLLRSPIHNFLGRKTLRVARGGSRNVAGARLRDWGAGCSSVCILILCVLSVLLRRSTLPLAARSALVDGLLLVVSRLLQLAGFFFFF